MSMKKIEKIEMITVFIVLAVVIGIIITQRMTTWSETSVDADDILETEIAEQSRDYEMISEDDNGADETNADDSESVSFLYEELLENQTETVAEEREEEQEIISEFLVTDSLIDVFEDDAEKSKLNSSDSESVNVSGNMDENDTGEHTAEVRDNMLTVDSTGSDEGLEAISDVSLPIDVFD